MANTKTMRYGALGGVSDQLNYHRMIKENQTTRKATIKAQISDPRGQYNTKRDVTIIKSQIETRQPWGIVVKGRYSVVVYDRNGKFKEVVERTAYPRQPLGAWMVWAIKYKGKIYSSMVDEIYGYLEIVEGNYSRRGKTTSIDVGYKV